jgi:hypothetical protein
MRKTLGKLILGTSASALALLASAGRVHADAMTTTTATTADTPTLQSYSTSGYIGSSDPTVSNGISNSNGDTTPAPVAFNPLTTGSFGLNSAVSLGEFTVSAVSDGSTWTYNNTPFHISYNPLKVGTTAYSGTPITIDGVLNGTVDGYTSNVTATFSKISTPTFQTPDGVYTSTLSIPNNPLALVASSAGGRTTIQGALVTTAATGTVPPSGGITDNPSPTPEPTTLTILATSLVGLGLRQRLRSGRNAS